MPIRREDAEPLIIEVVKKLISGSDSKAGAALAILAYAAGMDAMGQIFGLESAGEEFSLFVRREGDRILTESDSAASDYTWKPTDV